MCMHWLKYVRLNRKDRLKNMRGTGSQRALQVTNSYFYQTNTALYPVKSENSPTTADDR